MSNFDIPSEKQMEVVSRRCHKVYTSQGSHSQGELEGELEQRTDCDKETEVRHTVCHTFSAITKHHGLLGVSDR